MRDAQINARFSIFTSILAYMAFS